MARVVEQTIMIKFSRLVRDSSDEPILISDDDLAFAQSMADELERSDPSRVVELDLPED